MTHNDIYTKFMIEYDKANVTSSYPSLTEYEVATVLDKAYNALIAQKVTGNNYRRSGFEYDVKSISDIQPLITKKMFYLHDGYSNVKYTNVPDDFLYFVGADLNMWYRAGKTIRGELVNRLDDTNVKEGANIMTEAKLVDHNTAKKFISSNTNIPWVKTPVCYIEENEIYFVLDPLLCGTPKESTEFGNMFTDSGRLTYIKTPNKFVKDLSKIDGTNITYFSYDTINTAADLALYEFELNDTMAEELISLAVVFALENVESQRLNTKLNTRGLEA